MDQSNAITPINPYLVTADNAHSSDNNKIIWEEMGAIMASFPDELIMNILIHLVQGSKSVKPLFSVMQLNTQWNRVATDNYLWYEAAKIIHPQTTPSRINGRLPAAPMPWGNEGWMGFFQHGASFASRIDEAPSLSSLNSFYNDNKNAIETFHLPYVLNCAGECIIKIISEAKPHLLKDTIGLALVGKKEMLKKVRDQIKADVDQLTSQGIVLALVGWAATEIIPNHESEHAYAERFAEVGPLLDVLSEKLEAHTYGMRDLVKIIWAYNQLNVVDDDVEAFLGSAIVAKVQEATPSHLLSAWDGHGLIAIDNLDDYIKALATATQEKVSAGEKYAAEILEVVNQLLVTNDERPISESSQEQLRELKLSLTPQAE